MGRLKNFSTLTKKCWIILLIIKTWTKLLKSYLF
nr:MAG TPA: major prion protein [Caudoviricetes sp.]